MTRLLLGEALRTARTADPSDIPAVVLRVATLLGASDVVVYLVDFAQATLEPLPDHSTHADVPVSEPVVGSMAGRAFADLGPVVSEREGASRVWVPIVEGSDRTGVLALTVPDATEASLRECEELGLFAGYLIATQARATDLYNLRRRRRALSLAASMQWDLLPPLVLKTDRVAVAGLLEPAYDVGGDCFDYALNGSTLDLGIFDPMGHGVHSALIAALCVGAYRHDRREGRSIEAMHVALERAVRAEFPASFSTGQLARLDLDDGTLRITNAGHPLPLLLRSGRVVGEIECATTVPWGLGDVTNDGPHPTVTTVVLEPGDGVLFYTDGVTESHLPGAEPFGVDRLIDLTTQHASHLLEPEEVVRRLVHSLLDHQDDQLHDDATIVLLQWTGAEGEPPGPPMAQVRR